jgi:hypothetical protein
VKVVSDNRYLNILAESLLMNTGGCPETEASRSAGETCAASEVPSYSEVGKAGHGGKGTRGETFHKATNRRTHEVGIDEGES